MMKKNFLLPLFVAGLMMVSIVSLNSCQKSQETTTKEFIEKSNTPLVEEEITWDRATYECPYCHQELHNKDVHWHVFGNPEVIPEGFDMSEATNQTVPYIWDACLDGLSNEACPYSGALQGDTETIQIIMNELNVSQTVAEWMVLPRFHAHKVTYRVVVDGGMTNTWHVGGGVPGWPTDDPENPE